MPPTKFIALDIAIRHVRAEPDLPGPIPDQLMEMFHLSTDKGKFLEELLRATVTATKNNIIDRLQQEFNH